MKVVAVHDMLDAVIQSKYSIEIIKWLWYLVILSYQWKSTISDGINEYWEHSWVIKVKYVLQQTLLWNKIFDLRKNTECYFKLVNKI